MASGASVTSKKKGFRQRLVSRVFRSGSERRLAHCRSPGDRRKGILREGRSVFKCMGIRVLLFISSVDHASLSFLSVFILLSVFPSVCPHHSNPFQPKASSMMISPYSSVDIYYLLKWHRLSESNSRASDPICSVEDFFDEVLSGRALSKTGRQLGLLRCRLQKIHRGSVEVVHVGIQGELIVRETLGTGIFFRRQY